MDELIQARGITELIFTHHYSDELRAAVLALQSKHNLLIRDFIFGLRELDEKGESKGILKPYSAHDLDDENLGTRMDHFHEASIKKEADESQPLAPAE